MRAVLGVRRAIFTGALVALFSVTATGAHAQSPSDPLTPAQVAASRILDLDSPAPAHHEAHQPEADHDAAETAPPAVEENSHPG